MPLLKISAGFSELLPVKNIAGVIEAVNQFQISNFKFQIELWIVGDGPERDNLEQLSKSLKVKTKFWGRVENKKAREIMGKSDIFVLNSLHEGLPHALIEALAEGVPVIAAKIPAVTEILTDKVTGLLVNVDDPNDLAEKILEIKNYPNLAKNGRRLFEEKFTWEIHLKKLRDIFDSIS